MFHRLWQDTSLTSVGPVSASIPATCHRAVPGRVVACPEGDAEFTCFLGKTVVRAAPDMMARIAGAAGAAKESWSSSSREPPRRSASLPQAPCALFSCGLTNARDFPLPRPSRMCADRHRSATGGLSKSRQRARKGKSTVIVTAGHGSRQERVCPDSPRCHSKPVHVRPSVPRGRLPEPVATLPPCLIARGLLGRPPLGPLVRGAARHGAPDRDQRVAPQRLSGKRSTNDAADAAATCEAVTRALRAGRERAAAARAARAPSLASVRAAGTSHDQPRPGAGRWRWRTTSINTWISSRPLGGTRAGCGCVAAQAVDHRDLVVTREIPYLAAGTVLL